MTLKAVRKSKVDEMFVQRDIKGLEAEKDSIYMIACITRNPEWLKIFYDVCNKLDTLKNEMK